MNRVRSGFTLIELLVVIAIIAVLVGLLLPAVLRVREAANRVRCANNLKQIGLACHAYHDSRGSFPPGHTAWPSSDPLATSPGWGWAAHLLPFLEQTNLYQNIQFNLPIEHPANADARLMGLAILLCPSDPGVPMSFTIYNSAGQPIADAAPSSYAASWGIGELTSVPGLGEGVFYRNSHIRIADITDGTSNTTMIGDRAWSQAQAPWAGAVQAGVVRAGPQNPWPDATAPASIFCLVHNNWINIRSDPDGGLDDFSSAHPGGLNLLFADGSVRFLLDVTDPGPRHDNFKALGTRAGGEIVNCSEF
jgi:prepilin-type N-terminal cleavage/methylation domain-containing protein/prepilin-type processing-associated H-X9-DG protein